MPDSVNEHDLIQRALDDPNAFHELYSHYVRRVYGYVASRVSPPQDAEDIVAEVFLRVIKHFDQLRNRHATSFAAWLFTIVRHTVADHYRLNGEPESHIPLDANDHTAPADNQPDHIFTQEEDAAHLRRLILSLSDRKREIITLRYFGGLRNQEIADLLGIGEKTVSAYLSRALSELQDKYRTTQFTGGDIRDE